MRLIMIIIELSTSIFGYFSFSWRKTWWENSPRTLIVIPVVFCYDQTTWYQFNGIEFQRTLTKENFFWNGTKLDVCVCAVCVCRYVTMFTYSSGTFNNNNLAGAKICFVCFLWFCYEFLVHFFPRSNLFVLYFVASGYERNEENHSKGQKDVGVLGSDDVGNKTQRETYDTFFLFKQRRPKWNTHVVFWQGKTTQCGKKSDWNTQMNQLQVATLWFRLKWPEMLCGIKREMQKSTSFNKNE